MSGETMKPFITPTSAERYTTAHAPMRCQRNRNLLAIGLGATCIILATVLVGIAIWQTIRITELETNVKTLNRIVESMRVRLGLNYLDELEDFQKEYSKVFIDIPRNSTNSDDEDDLDDDDDDADLDEEEEEADALHDDDDDDEDDEFYPGEYTDVNYEDLDLDALVTKFSSYDSTEDDDEDDSTREDHNTSEQDNVFEDFEKFQDSKKKLSVRKTRSISNVSNGLPHYVDSYLANLNKTVPELKPESHEQQQQAVKFTSMRSQAKSFDAAHDLNVGHKRQFVGERAEMKQHSPLRPRSHRRRKIPIMKSGESLLSAKSIDQTHSAISVLPAAHFHLNRKVPDRHAAIRVDSYPGDMYIGAPSSTNDRGYERYFRVDNGVLTIREPGLYYIYAQVCYNNTHDQNGFVIFHGHKPFLQCLNTVPTNMPLKIHTCHTSGLIHLHTDETIHLRDFHTDRNVILKDTNNRSYFGLIKI